MKHKEITCSPSLRRLLLHLQEYCSADCCKSLAFNISVEKIKTWTDQESIVCKEEVYQELFEIRQTPIHEYDFVKLNIRGFNSEWSSTEFLDFIDSLTEKLHKAIYIEGI